MHLYHILPPIKFIVEVSSNPSGIHFSSPTCNKSPDVAYFPSSKSPSPSFVLFPHCHFWGQAQVISFLNCHHSLPTALFSNPVGGNSNCSPPATYKTSLTPPSFSSSVSSRPSSPLVSKSKHLLKS